MKEAAPHFDVFVTFDQNLQFQNPTGKQWLEIVVRVTRFNHVAAYRPQFAEIRDAVRQTKPGQSTYFKFGSHCLGRRAFKR